MNVIERMSRRRFLEVSAAGAVAVAAGFRPGAVAQGQPVAPEPWDLLIRGGTVIDPDAGLRGQRDVAIHRGLIAAVEAGIPADRARQVISAAGMLVLPGLVDIHAHVYDGANTFGIAPDVLAPLTGVTTHVDAGTVGANSYDGFRRWVVDRAMSRVFAFVNISRIGLGGLPVGELLNLDYADVDAAARTIAEHPDVAIGVKVRQGQLMVGNNGLEPLRRAIAAAERSGTAARVMCHVGGVPGPLSALIDLLRPGDLLTHPYSSLGNNLVQNGQVLPAVLAAKARGVLIDVGHGAQSFDFTIAEPALAQGLLPDTIGSDLHAVSVATPGRPYMPWVMSKFLSLGLTIEQVVAMTTVNPARAIGRVPGLGTLRVGAPADVAIMKLEERAVSFEDTNGHRRAGTQYLRPVETIRGGRSFGPLDAAAVPYP
jgi:dihydroorotase